MFPLGSLIFDQFLTSVGLERAAQVCYLKEKVGVHDSIEEAAQENEASKHCYH